MNHGFGQLVCCLEERWPHPEEARLIIQTHDYPDHDAVASAWGLSRLLAEIGYPSRIVYRGRLRSHSLLAMVGQLGIPLERLHDSDMAKLADWQALIVDGSPLRANARSLAGTVLGVVDHHPNPGDLDCPWVDVRTSYGSCASIVADLWMEAGREPDRDTATALLMGIQMDTDFLGRRVSPMDLAALQRIFFIADWEFGTSTLRTALSVEDLPQIEAALSHAQVDGNLFFTVVPTDCSQELISILADFFLRLREVSVTVIVESGGDDYHVSVRSRNTELSAAALLKRALAGMGQGGGHDHMAGGVIPPTAFPGEIPVFKRFKEAIEILQELQ